MKNFAAGENLTGTGEMENPWFQQSRLFDVSVDSASSFAQRQINGKKAKKKVFLFYRREFLEHSNGTDIRRNLRKFSTSLWKFQIAIINLNPWYNQMKSEKWSKNQFLLFFGISWWTNWLLQEGLAMFSGKNGLQYSNMVSERSYNRMLDIRKHPQSLDIIKSARRSTKNI